MRKNEPRTRRTIKQWWGGGGKGRAKNVGKSVALSAAGAATSAAIMLVARKRPEMAPWLNTMMNHMARHPWLALSAYISLRAAKGATDYALLRSGGRTYNMDPLQTAAQGVLVGRRIPFTRRVFGRRGTAATLAAGSAITDVAKQEAVKRPILGLGAVSRGPNPPELVYTGVGVLGNFGILGYRAIADRRRRRLLRPWSVSREGRRIIRQRANR
ncbi:MAG: hypothetical protein JXB14_04745 [Candidatus Altiarchaeota archaeon]|nr:hypothetical protein [Candidatus Altiarchaeota archaeon]